MPSHCARPFFVFGDCLPLSRRPSLEGGEKKEKKKRPPNSPGSFESPT